MIRLVLLGRTGNHLFQYAFGRVLAEKHGVPLLLDASWFNARGWAEVSHFLKLPLKAKVVRRLPLVARAMRKATGKHYWDYRGVPVIREAEGASPFDPRFFEAPAECFLFGYFQSHRYFSGMEESYRAELRGLLEASVAVDPVTREKLRAAQSVAVHVRRTDYLRHPDLHLCDIGYYREAMLRMRDELPGARFHIFSDDPDWCADVFRGSDQEVIRPVSSNPLHDLHLMSLASHHILANSTYSWWAAWIGEKPGQEVLMPARWKASDQDGWIEDRRLDHWRTVEGNPPGPA